ncbi:MAG TPA: nitroreductase family protein [Nitrososphaeraceae archaeon]|nr:nitroreductase family protein [Nitrososphaeraceae archaeon]
MSSPADILNRLFKETKTQDKLYPIDNNEIQGYNLEEILNTNIYNVMLNRRSQRKFEPKEVEEWKLDIIFAAADTAPTAGGFQGFEIFHIKNSDTKIKLVDAANRQPYVNAPLVLVFCMNPDRVKMNFESDILQKFSIQDATLAAAYAQLAAHSLGLSSIWIGMIDEEKVMEAINTDLVPSSILCIGYPKKILQPKPKRTLSELIHVIN